MLVAFGSAVLGSLLGPLIRMLVDVTSRFSIDGFDFPAFPLPRIRRRRKDDKYYQKGTYFWKNVKTHFNNVLKNILLDRTLDSSSFIDSAIDNIVESIEDSEYDY